MSVLNELRKAELNCFGLHPRPQCYVGLRIAGDNLVRWRFVSVEINYLNLSLTSILNLNFVAYFLREKFETMPSLPKTTEIKYGLIFT